MRDPESVLKGRLQELLQRDQRLQEHLRNEGNRAPDQIEDWMNVVEHDDVVENLEATTLEAVRNVAAALGRVENGSYGACTSCGGEIDERRLQALPETPVCITCARSDPDAAKRVVPEDVTP